MNNEAALDEALFIADGIIHADLSFEDLSFMCGALGCTVFLSAAEACSKDSEMPSKYRAFREKTYAQLSEGLSCLYTQKADGLSIDISLGSGLSGIIHALLLIHKISGQPNESLLEQAINLILRYSPAKEVSLDFYLGLSGYIYVLCELLDFYDEQDISDNSIFEAVLKKIEDAMDFLLACRALPFTADMEGNQERILLWDTLKCNSPISGLGHGMLGIAAALIKGCDKLKNSPDTVSEKRMSEYINASRDALRFEYATYSAKLCDWPDLRPTTSGIKSLHGVCSGASGIGLGLLSLRSDILSDERDKLLSLVHESCLTAPLRAEDHFCCGKSGLCEYLLTRYHISQDLADYEAAGILLSLMKNERIKEGTGYYRLNSVIPKTDVSLFFGSAGIGYELLRYHSPDKVPPVLL